MINPPDDLLEDLQSALPPELQVPTPEPGGKANGQAHFDHLYDRTSHIEPERGSVASNTVSVVLLVLCY